MYPSRTVFPSRPVEFFFRPGLSLSAADPAQAAAWVQVNSLLQSPPIPVDRFGLYSSTLGRERSVYRLEADYPF